jgi:hypothetical protein
MRHHLVVNLQPIGMVYEIMDRRLRAERPNLADIQDGAQKINSYARAALTSCLDVVTWLAPEDGARITAVDGMRECAALVGTSFSFRGYALRNEVGDAPGQVSRAAFRNVVTGALLHLSDGHEPPAEIVIEAQAQPAGLGMILTVRESRGDQGFATAPAYRPLTVGDLQALAAPEGVQLQREGAKLLITFPWVRAGA